MRASPLPPHALAQPSLPPLALAYLAYCSLLFTPPLHTSVFAQFAPPPREAVRPTPAHRMPHSRGTQPRPSPAPPRT
eukprot:2613287-Prymnesium_polylepis.1